MDLDKLSLSDKIIAGTGIVLLIDLLFLPWHSVDLGPLGDYSRSGVESPNSFWGIVALLLTIAVVAVTVVRVFKPETKLPDLPVTWDRAIFFGAVATLAVLLLKLVMETDYLGFGAWLGILLAAGMTYGGYLKFQAETASTGNAGIA
ncbi:MAG TPA: hypothetical protein VFU14_02950 [Acidimicrobiales bacterium]|nr:hypothetical protein [Acidimicrobiales bacterium]